MNAPLKNIYSHIEDRCERVGITVYGLFVTHLKKRPEQLSHWKKQDPKTIQLYREIIEKLDELESSKNGKTDTV